jgi:uncharacterized protein RhaS with RHS repeats
MKSTSGGGVFAYDANGNMITRTTSTNATTYTQVWNADNKLSEVKNSSTTLAQFFYDADGARVKKVEGNTTTIYVGEHYEKNISTGAITKYYYFGGK